MRNPSSSSSSTTTKLTPCCAKVGLKKGPWTPEEDEKLGKFVKREGEGGWRTLPKRAGLLRCGKSCRLRWMNYLRPNVKRGQIAPDEEDLILRLHRLLGNRWSLIAGRIPGRTDNEIKNYWNTHLSKKLISQGIDPRTHKPLVLFNMITNNNNNSSEDPKPPSSIPSNIPISPGPSTNPSPNPSPSTNPNHSFGLKETINGNILHYGYLESNNLLNQQEYQAQTNGIIGNRYEDNMNYCNPTDDVFTSFLNSFINEDVFLSQHQQLHEASDNPINGNIEAPFGSSNALMSYTEAFGLNNTNWESALMSGFNLSNNGLRRFNEDDHV